MARSILVVSVLVGGVAVAAPANKPVAAATTKHQSSKVHHRAKATKVAKVKKARKHAAKRHHK